MDTLKLIGTGRMVHIIPLILWTAASTALFSGSFVVLISATMDDKVYDN